PAPPAAQARRLALRRAPQHPPRTWLGRRRLPPLSSGRPFPLDRLEGLRAALVGQRRRRLPRARALLRGDRPGRPRLRPRADDAALPPRPAVALEAARGPFRRAPARPERARPAQRGRLPRLREARARCPGRALLAAAALTGGRP